MRGQVAYCGGTGWKVRLAAVLRSKMGHPVLSVITIGLGPGPDLEPSLVQGNHLWTALSQAGSLALAISQPSTALPIPILGLLLIETHQVKSLHFSSSLASLEFYSLKVGGTNHSSNNSEVLSQLAAK